MRFPGKVLINDNTYEFGFHDLLDYSIFHNKMNISIKFLLPRVKNHKVRISQIVR